MKPILCIFAAVAICFATAQGHDSKPAEAMKAIEFLTGEWTGKQEFITGGAPMTGDVTAHIHDAIGGRYIEESLSTALPGRKPSDTRHFLTFDPKSGTYKAWWFNDSSVGAMELEGTLTGNKLVLFSKPTQTGAGPGTVFRATYEGTDGGLHYMLEMKDGENWRPLFHTTYSKK